MLEASQSQLINEWQQTKDRLDVIKEHEQTLRAQIALNVFPDAKEGANTIELGAGYRITYTPKTNYNLTVPAGLPESVKLNQAMELMAEDMRRASNEGAFIFERLVSFKPSLSVTEYKRLSPELKAIVDRYVVTSEGAPSISIKAPAAKKGE